MNPLKLWNAWRAWITLQRAFKEYCMSREPVMIASIVNAAAILLSIFGFNLTQEQVGAVVVVAGLVAGVVARARVTPIAP